MPSPSARLLLGGAAVTLTIVVVALATWDRADTPRTTATSAPDPAFVDIQLPAEFEPRESLVSPDGRYVAALARDRGTARLYRLGPLTPGTVSRQLQQIAEVHGYAQYGDVSWLDDSSALLVRSDLIPGHTLQNRDAKAVFRVVMLDTDGRVVTAPADVTGSLLTSYPQRRTPLSSDGRWLPVGDDCCVSRVRLLARSGLEVKTIVAAPTDGSTVAFFGWDSDGYLQYQQSWPDRSALITLDADNSIRYRVSAPAEFGGARWGPVATAPDRSWRVIQFGYGIGSSFREYRLLVGSQLRPLPPEVEEAARYAAVFARGSEIVYRTPTGPMHAYDVRTGATRTLGLVVAPGTGIGVPTTIGVVGRYFVWMEMLRGFVGDLESGASVPLALPNPPASDRLDGAFLAVYRPNGVVIVDLTMMLR